MKFVSINNIIGRFDDLRAKASSLPHRDEGELYSIVQRAKVFARQIFGEKSPHLEEFDAVHSSFWPNAVHPNKEENERRRNERWPKAQKELVHLLNAMREEFELNLELAVAARGKEKSPPMGFDPN